MKKRKNNLVQRPTNTYRKSWKRQRVVIRLNPAGQGTAEPRPSGAGEGGLWDCGLAECWKLWLSGFLRLRCLFWVPDNFPETSDRSPAFLCLLDMNVIERCSWYLSLKFLSEYSFVRLLDFFLFYLVLFFLFRFCYFYQLSIFIYFLANPPEPQQGRAGYHGTADLTQTWPPDLTDPVGLGCVNPALDPWFPGPGRDTVPPGPLWVLYPRDHWDTGGTASLSGYGRLGYRQAGLPQYSSATVQLPPAPPYPPALGWGLGLGSQLQTRLKGERWVSGGAGGRREERGWILPENWIFDIFL